MSSRHNTEGICLRRVDYSETSQVATFLVPDAGRPGFIAKGAKRAPKKGIKRGFDLLCRYELSYTRRPHGSLHNLLNWQLVESFQGIRSSLERIMHGYAATELMLNFAIEEQPCPHLYSTFLDTLRRFASGRDCGTALLLLEMETLRLDGTLPRFTECGHCGAEVSGPGQVLFSALEGGPICERCGRDRTLRRAGILKVDGAHLSIAGRLARRRSIDPAKLKLTAEQVGGISRVLRHHIQFLLGKKLRTWPYLEPSALPRLFERVRRAG